jgi:hypothetical protein
MEEDAKLAEEEIRDKVMGRKENETEEEVAVGLNLEAVREEYDDKTGTEDTMKLHIGSLNCRQRLGG